VVGGALVFFFGHFFICTGFFVPFGKNHKEKMMCPKKKPPPAYWFFMGKEKSPSPFLFFGLVFLCPYKKTNMP